jgi:small subunit ribosomal protein S17
MDNKDYRKLKRYFTGKVVSTKMNKTAVVEVQRIKIHPKYKKRYKVQKRYKIHDERNECKVGDVVIFQECRPLSKEKRWRLIKIVERAEVE